eukprot:655401-Prymnesium_polylepis.1
MAERLCGCVHSMFLTTAFCMPFIGVTPDCLAGAAADSFFAAGASAFAAGAATGGAGASVREAFVGRPAARRTSSAVIRPKLPVPVSVSSLIPFDLASFLACGDGGGGSTRRACGRR